MVKAHGELDHQLATDCHVHDGPVAGGRGVLVHDVHMLIGVEVRNIWGLSSELREDEPEAVLSHHHLLICVLLSCADSKCHFPTFLCV